MADAPVSQLTLFTPQPGMYIMVVDPTALPGLKNGRILVSNLLAGDLSGATVTVPGSAAITLASLASAVAALQAAVAALQAAATGSSVGGATSNFSTDFSQDFR